MCFVTCIWDLITIFFSLVGSVGGELLVLGCEISKHFVKDALQMQWMPLILSHQYPKSYQKQSRMWAAEFYVNAASLLKRLIFSLRPSASCTAAHVPAAATAPAAAAASPGADTGPVLSRSLFFTLYSTFFFILPLWSSVLWKQWCSRLLHVC